MVANYGFYRKLARTSTMDISTTEATSLPVLPVPAGIASRKGDAKRAPWGRRFVIGFGLFLLLVITGLWVIGVFGGNVRTIEPGRAYRSSTLTGLNYTGITARWAGNDLDS